MNPFSEQVKVYRLFESFIQDNLDVMYEGLVINEIDKTISLTDEHNRGIDMTLENLPIEYKLNGIDVISIFKRTPYISNKRHEPDGNPFIYALKGINNWKFDMPEADVIKYMKRFLNVCKKIKNRYDTIVTVPSQSWLNKRFMDVIAEQVKAKYKICDYFYKSTLDDAWNSIDGKLIRQQAIKDNRNFPEQEAQHIIDVLRDNFSDMADMNLTYFAAKYVNKKYLHCITKPISTNTKNMAECAEYFNDKDVLILDDILASGTTLSHCANNILTTYSPKSVTAITLLSKKFN